MNKGQIIILDHCFMSHFSSVFSYFSTYLFLRLSFWFYLLSFLFIYLVALDTWLQKYAYCHEREPRLQAKLNHSGYIHQP